MVLLSEIYPDKNNEQRQTCRSDNGALLSVLTVVVVLRFNTLFCTQKRIFSLCKCGLATSF